MNDQNNTVLWADAAGKEWSAFITLETAQRLENLGLDLFNPDELADVIRHPLKWVELVCRVHQPQWDDRDKMHIGDFAEVCTSTESVASAAFDATMAALSNFFRRLRKPAMAAVVDRAVAAAKRTEEMALQKIEQAGAEAFDAAIAKAGVELDRAIAKAKAAADNPESNGA